MKNAFDLTGKRALVTGATHGLGMAMAKGLAEYGASVIISGHSPEKMKTALAEYKKNNLDVHGVLFNVTDDQAVAAAISDIETSIGPLDILINNAGIIKRTPILQMTVEDFREVLDVNITGSFLVSKHVGKYMVTRRSGKIINICSMMSELGRNTVTAYAAAKGGLKMLTKNMATEWAQYNIQVNGIGPGYFATDQTAPIRTDGHPFNDFILNRTPAGRWGNPEDLVGATVFLSSAASNFVNGQILYVDGGILATIGKPVNE